MAADRLMLAEPSKGPGMLPWLIGIPLAVLVGLLTPFLGFRPLLAVLGVAGCAVIFWRPYIGFLLVIASVPADVFGVLGSTTSSVALSVTKLLGVLTLAAAVLDLLIHQRSVRPSHFWTPETGAAALFTLVTVLSAAAHLTEESRVEILRLVTILVFVLTTLYFVDTAERLRHVVYVLVIVATLVSLQSIIQRAGGATNISEEWVAEAGAVLDVGEEATGEFLRTSGTFSHPAWLGLFLTLTIPLALYIAWTAPSRALSLAALASVPVQILGVFSTYSRMAYIGVALGIGLFTLRRRGGPAMIVVLILAAIVSFPLLPEDVRLRMESILDYQASSSSLTRIGQQIAGIDMFRRNPLLGVGPGNYEHEVHRYANRIPEVYNVQAIGAHNMYVEIAAELGVPGLLACALLLGIAWRDARRLRVAALRRGDRHDALLFECLGVALIVFIVSAMFVHAQYRKEWWLLAALIGAGVRIRRASPEVSSA